ncbi:hypothetical protein L596_006829 [Steinernema carpocapsae]|uniref:Uncharacterized protein n=1 Tax=Steinernema carpocapsae TaxID=34508 RepID=A0A4V6A5U3_STECR|nr:hypothetical protein L596_006829 [Steinernema carpocapsae]
MSLDGFKDTFKMNMINKLPASSALLERFLPTLDNDDKATQNEFLSCPASPTSLLVKILPCCDKKFGFISAEYLANRIGSEQNLEMKMELVKALIEFESVNPDSSVITQLLSSLEIVRVSLFRLFAQMLEIDPTPFFNTKIPSASRSSGNAFECFVLLAQTDQFYQTIKLEKAVIPKFVAMIRKKDKYALACCRKIPSSLVRPYFRSSSIGRGEIQMGSNRPSNRSSTGKSWRTLFPSKRGRRLLQKLSSFPS